MFYPHPQCSRHAKNKQANKPCLKRADELQTYISFLKLCIYCVCVLICVHMKKGSQKATFGNPFSHSTLLKQSFFGFFCTAYSRIGAPGVLNSQVSESHIAIQVLGLQIHVTISDFLHAFYESNSGHWFALQALLRVEPSPQPGK